MLYNFSKEQYFKNGCNIKNLHYAIQKNIQKTLYGVTTDDVNVTIEFSNNLSQSEENILNNLLVNNDPTKQTILNFKTIIPKDNSIKSKTFKKLTSFIYPGTNIFPSIVSIKMISYNSDDEPYYVRFYDVTNKNIIAEGVFNNTNVQINTINTIINLPTDSSIFEIQIKSENTVVIEEINYYY